ncbi:hypothetical protein FYK55_06370 [Roseiconus nitratireducens]|uniref:Response regulatory domain-containing protein n=1 Tax=Roseiconus nitratireducens TaxID=2605748 RepID=A0A5M6DCJ1_9BACT|nr:hypothetical protein [Roseiconus nitratireducens]KAA5545278.1 hypothetical protein FYK55_06370 [Roseiconus nitratireducens]
MPVRLLILLSLLLAPAVSDRLASAQDDAASEQPPDELVRQLESTAAQGGDRLPQAIESLARIGAWPQVDRWLAKLDEVQDQNELARAAQIIGNNLLLRISLREELGDASRSALGKLTAAAKAVMESPQRLSQALEQLGSSQIDDRLNANRTLLQGGNASIQTIVGAVGKGLPQPQRGRALKVLRSLGDGGQQALQQLALYGAASVRANALAALIEIAPDAATDVAVSAAFAEDAGDQERQLAADFLNAISPGMTLDRSVAYLADRLRTARSVAARTSNDPTPAILWSVNEDRTGVDFVRTTELYAQYRQAYDAGQQLLRLGDVPPKAFQSALAADLAYRVLVDVMWGDEDQVQAILKTYGDRLTPQQIQLALGAARRDHQVPAAVGLLRLLTMLLTDDSAPSASDARSMLLTDDAGGSSEVVQATLDPDPRVRYEAAAMIDRVAGPLTDDVSFAGSSYVRKTLAEMSRLSRQPSVVLIETRPLVALRQETILGQLGYQVRAVQSVAAAERAVSQGGDLRMVLSKLRLADATPTELVDRIRRLPKGKHTPIVFFQDDDADERVVKAAELETTSLRWSDATTPAVYLVPLPGSINAFADVRAEVESKRRLPPLSVSERLNFQAIGTRALQDAKIAR